MRLHPDRQKWLPFKPALTLIQDVCDLLEPFVTGKNITLRRLCLELLVVRADSDRIAQVVTNLLENAIKFTAPGGTVRLTCEQVDEGCKISVSDTGPGIPLDEIDEVFKLYWTADRGKSGHGLGLGLTIAKRIIEQHQGRIWVTSDSAGSTFSFIIPIATQGSVHPNSHHPEAA